MEHREGGKKWTPSTYKGWKEKVFGNPEGRLETEDDPSRDNQYGLNDDDIAKLLAPFDLGRIEYAPKDTRYNFRLSTELLEAARQKAKDNDIEVSFLIRKALESVLVGYLKP